MASSSPSATVGRRKAMPSYIRQQKQQDDQKNMDQQVCPTLREKKRKEPMAVNPASTNQGSIATENNHQQQQDDPMAVNPASTNPALIATDNNHLTLPNETEEKPFDTTTSTEADVKYDNVSERIKELVRNQSSRLSAEPEPVGQVTEQSPSKTDIQKEPKRSPYHVPQTVMIVFAIVFVALAVSVAYYLSNKAPKKAAIARHSCPRFQQLTSKYPNTDDMLWASLIVGVERAVKDPGEPATFIFLYNSSSIGQSLLNDVIDITLECFGTGNAIWRSSNDFKSAEMTQDYEHVLNRYRQELTSQGVLVVGDLDQVPPAAAPIFFTMCDEYEPLVRKAATFFTIDISQRSNNWTKLEPTPIAKEILKASWGKELRPNMLDPLLVRLTGNVFVIQ